MKCAKCLKEYPEKEMVTQLGTKICINCVKKNRRDLWIVGGIILGIFLLFLILISVLAK